MDTNANADAAHDITITYFNYVGMGTVEAAFGIRTKSGIHLNHLTLRCVPGHRIGWPTRPVIKQKDDTLAPASKRALKEPRLGPVRLASGGYLAETTVEFDSPDLRAQWDEAVLDAVNCYRRQVSP